MRIADVNKIGVVTVGRGPAYLLPVQPIHTLLQEGYAGQHIVPDLLHPCTLTLTVTAMQSRRGGLYGAC